MQSQGIKLALQILDLHDQSQGLVDLRKECKAAVGMRIPMGILWVLAWNGYGDCDQSYWIMEILRGFLMDVRFSENAVNMG